MSINLVCRFIFSVIIFPIHSFAAEGTIGWSYFYLGKGGLQYAESPMSACNKARISTTNGLLTIEPSSSAGTSYDCWFKLRLNAEGLGYTSTSLVCSDGYSPKFPGVCVKRIPRVTSIVPPVSPSTSVESLMCSASNPGFTIGNPIVVSNGTKIQQEHDISANQWGTLDISRTYRYMRSPVDATTAGTLWSFSFEREFLIKNTPPGSQPQNISITTGDGSVVSFNRLDSDYRPEVATSDALYPISPQYDEWIYKNSFGKMEHFKKIGTRYLLISVTSKEGQGTYYSYNNNGKLNAISDSFGRTLNVEWQNDRAIAYIRATEYSVHYRYDQLEHDAGFIVALQRIASVQVDDSHGELQGLKEYHYGEGWPDWFYLTGITDENGARFATYSYDAQGRVTRSEHADGAQRFDFSYPSDLTRLVTDPLGSARTITLAPVANQLRVTSFNQPGGAGCGPAASAYAYNAQGTLQSRSDFNQIKTCFIYDPVRNLEISHTDGIPAAAACPAASALPGSGQRKVTTRWHPDWAAETMIAEPLKLTAYIYNGQPDIDGSIASCGAGGLLPDGRPIVVLCKKIENATTDVNGGAGFNAGKTGAPRIFSYTYNQSGQVLSSTIWGRAGSTGDTMHYEYFTDTTANHTLGDLSKVTGPTGQVLEFLEYTPSGLPTKIKEPAGQLVELSYDTRQNLTRRVMTAAGTGEQITRYSYDRVGQLTRVDLPDSTHLAYRYDDAHRLTGITDNLGNTIQYFLDPMGNRIREEVRDPAGKLARQIIRVYDPLNRIQAVTEGVL